MLSGGAPSGTTLRFGTLVFLAVASTLHVYGAIGSARPVGGVLKNAQCQVRANLYLTRVGIPDPDESKWAAYNECMSSVFLPRLGWLVAGLLSLALLSVVIYQVGPAWRIRRSRLRRLDEVSGLWETLRGPLGDLVAVAGLRRTPEFLLDPTSPRAGGVAFGRGRRPFVCLDAGLVALFDGNREAFNAIVLHELAHLRNRDVTTTYLASAVWRSFLVVGLIPYILFWLDPMLSLANPLSVPRALPSLESSLANVVIRLAALVPLVYLARLAVLRSRERYADALVASWTGRQDPYQSLARLRRRRVFSWVAAHPSRRARDMAMRNPRSLLRPGFWEVLASGLAIQLVWSHLTSGLAAIYWYRDGNESLMVMRVGWGIAIGLLVTVIAWRGAAYLRAGAEQRGVFAQAGLALGLGLVLGQFLRIQAVADPFAHQVSPARLVLLASLTAASVLVCVWAGYCARLLGEGARGWRGLLGAGAVILVCVSCLGWIDKYQAADFLWQTLLKPAMVILDGYARGSGWSSLDGPVAKVIASVFLLTYPRVLTAASLLVVWLLPLLVMRDIGRRVRTGVLAAGVGASAWVAALVGLRWATSGRDGAAFVLLLSAWEIAAAVIAQLVVAVVITRHGDWVTAALATWTLGVLACVGMWIAHWGNGHVDSVIAARPFQVLPFMGTVMTLLAAIATRQRPGRSTLRPARSWHPFLVGVLATSTVAVVWWPTAPTAAELLPPVRTSAAFDPDDAITAWHYGGGWNTFLSVQTARSAAVNAILGRADDRQIAEACEALHLSVRSAASFPKPPVARVRDSWTAVLDDLAAAANACVRTHRGQEDASDIMFAKFHSGAEHMLEIMGQLNSARERSVGQ
jgi:Zn-dependent protease with chaperone function